MAIYGRMKAKSWSRARNHVPGADNVGSLPLDSIKTHALRLLGPKTILNKACGLFWALGLWIGIRIWTEGQSVFNVTRTWTLGVNFPVCTQGPPNYIYIYTYIHTYIHTYIQFLAVACTQDHEAVLKKQQYKSRWALYPQVRTSGAANLWRKNLNRNPKQSRSECLALILCSDNMKSCSGSEDRVEGFMGV